MPNDSESNTSSQSNVPVSPPSGWLRPGVLAALSAVTAGLAAAWWYRKTLTRLRQAEEIIPNPQFGIPEEDRADQS
jgi:hypothetical protein